MTKLQHLEHHDEFLARHIGPNDEEIAQMLAANEAERVRRRHVP